LPPVVQKQSERFTSKSEKGLENRDNEDGGPSAGSDAEKKLDWKNALRRGWGFAFNDKKPKRRVNCRGIDGGLEVGKIRKHSCQKTTEAADEE